MKQTLCYIHKFNFSLAIGKLTIVMTTISYRMDDKQIEVVGMYSSLHIGTIQVSLAEPLRIGQASEVKVRGMWLVH